MQKLFLIIVFIFLKSPAFAQSDSIYAEIQVKSFTYGRDTYKLKKPKVFILEKYGCTDIISLGSIKENEIGLQFEILKSNLGGKSIVVNGKGYFLKKDGEWKMSSVTTYQQSDCKIISDKSEISSKDFVVSSVSNSSVTTKSELTIEFLQRFYILK
jgi:hypothetical protein